MEFSEVVRKRRSVRSYRPERPDRAVLRRIVDAARKAPTAGFSQGVDFLVLDEREALATFWRLAEDSPPEHPPPVLVMVFSDPQRYRARYSEPDKLEFGLDDLNAWPVRFWDVDAGMAAMQLQLAAVDAGLDSWFFGIRDDSEVRKHFGVPEDRTSIGIVALGYAHPDDRPDGSAISQRRRPLDDQLHLNGWSE